MTKKYIVKYLYSGNSLIECRKSIIVRHNELFLFNEWNIVFLRLLM